MAMSTKDFVALAKALAEIESHPVRIVAANKVADVCAAHNKLFDRDLFLKAANAKPATFSVVPESLSVLK